MSAIPYNCPRRCGCYRGEIWRYVEEQGTRVWALIGYAVRCERRQFNQSKPESHG